MINVCLVYNFPYLVDKSCWPTLKTLLLLRLWSLVFPCSDFRHVVMTPTLLLMCEYLMRCPIKSSRDATVGSFLCSMVLSVSAHCIIFFSCQVLGEVITKLFLCV